MNTEMLQWEKGQLTTLEAFTKTGSIIDLLDAAIAALHRGEVVAYATLTLMKSTVETYVELQAPDKMENFFVKEFSSFDTTPWLILQWVEKLPAFTDVLVLEEVDLLCSTYCPKTEGWERQRQLVRQEVQDVLAWLNVVGLTAQQSRRNS